jgi:hypothetical protein
VATKITKTMIWEIVETLGCKMLLDSKEEVKIILDRQEEAKAWTEAEDSNLR